MLLKNAYYFIRKNTEKCKNVQTQIRIFFLISKSIYINKLDVLYYTCRLNI